MGVRVMRGLDARSGSLFSYVDIEARVPAKHPLRSIRDLVNGTLAALDRDFAGLYSLIGRPSIAPERLLRASLLQMLYSIRSERQLVERLEFDLLFRWFVGLVCRILASTSRCSTRRRSRRTGTGC
jgi:transposase